MKFTSLIFSALLTHAAAADPTVFDVRRNLPLNDVDKVFHDYLVDAGSEAGLKPGAILTVTRHLPIYDYYRFRSMGDLQLQVAKVRVIAAQDGMAVVRLREEISREDASILEDNFVMIGDTLDLATLVAEAPPAASAAAKVETAAPEKKPEATIVVNSVDVSKEPAKVDTQSADQTEKPASAK